MNPIVYEVVIKENGCPPYMERTKHIWFHEGFLHYKTEDGWTTSYPASALSMVRVREVNE